MNEGIAPWSRYTLAALGYAEAAVTGWLDAPWSKHQRPVGRLERLAAQRFLDDLARAADGWGYHYSDGHAAKAIEHMERLVHVKGKWRGKPIRFEPVQLFALCQVFGWLDADNRRRFRLVYEEMGRKNAKSTKQMAVGHYMLAGDGEPGAEIYNGASTATDAAFIWEPAKRAAELAPDYQRDHRLAIGAKRIEHLPSGSVWTPVVGEPPDGGSPHFAAVDELHQHRTSAQLDTMQTGMGARDQPVLWVTTTGGDDLTGVCYELRTRVGSILVDGSKDEDDQRTLVLIFAMDEEDDWRSFGNLLKANPLVGASVPVEFLRGQHDVAVKSPSSRGTILSRHGGRWGNTARPWVDQADLLRAMERGRNRLDWPALRAESYVRVAVSLDASVRKDLCSWAVTACVTRPGEPPHYLVKGRHHLPARVLAEPNRAWLKTWAERGYLVEHEGGEIDLSVIEREIIDTVKDLGAGYFVYDNHYATQLAQNVEKATGVERIEPRLGSSLVLSPAMREVEAALAGDRIDYDGDPVLQWALTNVQVYEDERNNIYPRKPKTTANADKKIDPAFAAIMGMLPFVKVEEIDDGCVKWEIGQEIVAA
ncbi:MAG: terminase large subunit [Pseudomonadota bacterium]